jgi:hypothetical protein
MPAYSFGETIVIDSPISIDEIQTMAAGGFGDMVKAVVDLDKRIMALNAELHADEEAVLLSRGSDKQNLWGISLYPDRFPTDWVEFDSMINIRPKQGNHTRRVEDQTIRDKIMGVVTKLVV